MLAQHVGSIRDVLSDPLQHDLEGVRQVHSGSPLASAIVVEFGDGLETDLTDAMAAADEAGPGRISVIGCELRPAALRASEKRQAEIFEGAGGDRAVISFFDTVCCGDVENG